MGGNPVLGLPPKERVVQNSVRNSELRCLSVSLDPVRTEDLLQELGGSESLNRDTRRYCLVLLGCCLGEGGRGQVELP